MTAKYPYSHMAVKFVPFAFLDKNYATMVRGILSSSILLVSSLVVGIVIVIGLLACTAVGVAAGVYGLRWFHGE